MCVGRCVLEKSGCRYIEIVRGRERGNRYTFDGEKESVFERIQCGGIRDGMPLRECEEKRQGRVKKREREKWKKEREREGVLEIESQIEFQQNLKISESFFVESRYISAENKFNSQQFFCRFIRFTIFVPCLKGQNPAPFMFIFVLFSTQ